VYSLGCTLFHLLSGHPPYRAPQGKSIKEYLEVMRMHLTAPIPDIRAEMPDTDPDLAEAVAAMMTKDRNLRPTFEEIARRLARIASRLDGELPRVTRQLFTVPPSSKQGSSSVEETPVPIPRNWSRIVFLAVVVAGAIGLGIVLGR
jgi:serine/threonine protein kinase